LSSAQALAATHRTARKRQKTLGRRASAPRFEGGITAARPRATLHCTHSAGLVVNRGGTVIHVRPGDTVWTPPSEEHWHGATVDCMMCHLAMLEGTDDGDGTTWLEPVTDEQYAAAQTQ
jgi:hypothetical protein